MCLFSFITYLIEHHNVEASGIHLIGYSLGAHLFGFVGKGIPGINRITGKYLFYPIRYCNIQLYFILGLDPAERNFEDDSKQRLSKSDARFVDVVHTNTAEDGYGLRDSVGKMWNQLTIY